MTRRQRLTVTEDVRALSLDGARLERLDVAEYSVDLILRISGERTATICIESAGGLSEQGLDPDVIDAGPELGDALSP